MGDGTQTYMFSFGPLSGLADLAKGLPGTQFPSAFNSLVTSTLRPGDPATTDGSNTTTPYNFTSTTTTSTTQPPFNWNGAVGLVPDVDANGGTPS
jgi:hypothetical protein